MASVSTIKQGPRLQVNVKQIVFAAVVLVLAFSIFYPLVLLIINSFAINDPNTGVSLGRYGLDAWHYAFTDKGMLRALWNSFTVMATQQLISFPIAIGIAWVLARTNIPGARWLEFMFWVAFFLPTVPVVQAWILLAHPTAGLLNIWLAKLPFIDTGLFNIYSFPGIIWAHLATKAIAIKVMILTPAFRNMDAALEDASRISGASSFRTLLRVTAPVLTPALIVMLMLSVIFTFQSVEIELILGLPIKFFVFGSKIFDLTRLEPPLYGAATAMGVVILIAVIPLIVTQRWVATRRRYTTITSRYQPQVLILRKMRWPFFAIVLAIGLMVTVVPFTFLLMGTFMKIYGFFDLPGGSWTMKWWSGILGDRVFMRALKNTLLLGLGGATLSSIFFSLVAYFIVRGKSRLGPVVDIMTWVPYGLPGIVLVLAWLWIFLRTPFLTPLHGTLLALILVSGISGLTLGVQILKASLLQLGDELEEASMVVGAGWLRTFRSVVLPLLIPTMLVVWVINFVSAVGQAIMPAMLGTPSSRPLATLQLENLLAGQQEAASVVGVIVVILTFGVAGVARAFGLRIGIARPA